MNHYMLYLFNDASPRHFVGPRKLICQDLIIFFSQPDLTFDQNVSIQHTFSQALAMASVLSELLGVTLRYISIARECSPFISQSLA